MSEPAKIARRPLLLALAALLGVGVVGGGIYESSGLWRRHRSASAYDDLLAGLTDRDAANRLGNAVLAETETFSIRDTARELRTRIGHRSLSAALGEDMAQDRISEAGGWILPETLALLCALAAKVG